MRLFLPNHLGRHVAFGPDVPRVQLRMALHRQDLPDPGGGEGVLNNLVQTAAQ